MEFWLSFNNLQERLQLPVNPSRFRISTGNNNDTINIENLGEFNLIGNANLATIEIASFFPAVYAPYCAYRDIPNPYDTVEQIEKWRKSKKPIRLIITETPVNIAVAIESFKYGEIGGTRDVEYTLSLKEYRFIKVQKVTDPTPEGMSEPRPDDKEQPKTYTVRSGDTLYMIAKKIYGKGDKWRDLYNANKSTIGPDPDLIKPGQQLVVV